MCIIFEKALLMLADKPCSTYQLSRYLYRTFSKVQNYQLKIQEVLSKISKLNLIDEHYIAYNLAIRYSNKGDKFIRYILHQKGIVNEVINKTITYLKPELTRALTLVQQEFFLHPRTTDSLEKFLEGRHFSKNTIKYCLDRWKENEK